MPNRPFVLSLIDKASEQAGSDYKLAAMLHVSRFAVSAWKHGKKPVPTADVALMAYIAGLDPQAWAARDLIAKHEGTAKGEALFNALGKALGVIGAGAGSFGTNAMPINPSNVVDLIRCIERQVVQKQQPTVLSTQTVLFHEPNSAIGGEPLKMFNERRFWLRRNEPRLGGPPRRQALERRNLNRMVPWRED